MDQKRRQAMVAGTAAKLPVGRIGQPDDMADAILFTLASDFLTGAVIDIDGGAHLPRG
jgi:NAD(P)-dependent dehydrogenase (short-subunit alcohol dehydrogenase family)